MPQSMKYILSGVLALTIGCSSTGPVKELSESYETVVGTLAAPPVPENDKDRLFIYLKVQPEEGDPYILICVAENKDNEKVLSNLAARLNKAPSATVYIYGKKIRGEQWYEYVDGIDFLIIAVGVYNASAERHMIVLTDYGESLNHAVSSIKWGTFLSVLGKAAIKQVTR